MLHYSTVEFMSEAEWPFRKKNKEISDTCSKTDIYSDKSAVANCVNIRDTCEANIRILYTDVHYKWI